MIIIVIERIKNETAHCKTFYFKAHDHESFAYLPGQFITLILHHNKIEQRRSYSLSSTPGVDELPSFTVKRIQNGAISRYLFDHLKMGDTLQALAPAGRFTIKEPKDVNFFIAAGSGITPIFAHIKHLLYNQDFARVVLVYQNPNETSSIFRIDLLGLQNKFADRFNFIELFSQPQDGQHTPQRLNNYLVEKLVIENVHSASVNFYVCGPRALMLIVKFTLRVMGYKEDQIFKENFVIDHIPPPPAITDTRPHNALVHLNNRQHHFIVNYPENILEAALKNNVQLPFSCRGGRCSTCTAQCVKGRIKMSLNEVLTDKDVENGLVLTCLGYPESDIELVFP